MMKIKSSKLNYYKLEPILVAKINKCNQRQLDEMIKRGYWDDDHYHYLSDQETIKSFIECYANYDEMKEILKIIKDDYESQCNHCDNESMLKCGFMMWDECDYDEVKMK